MCNLLFLLITSQLSNLISDINIKNNNGPSTVPCGTPLITWLSVLNPPGILTTNHNNT